MPIPMYQRREEPVVPLAGVKKTFGIAAGKGGVGKSTVTVSLARALQRRGFHVGVMDTDLYGPSIRKMLPEGRMPEQRGERIIPADAEGIKLISMAYFRSEDEASAVRAPIANRILGQFIQGVEWGELDYLLIDFPPGTGDIQLTLGQQARLSGAIMVTTPQEVALMDVRKAMDLFRQMQVPIVGVIENMSYYRHEGKGEPIYLFGKRGGERLACEEGVSFLGEVPVDPMVSACGDSGGALPEGSSAAQAFDEIAARIVAMPVAEQLAIVKLYQDERATFVIEWSDGSSDRFPLAALQRQCPCAGCFEKREQGALHVDDQVEVESISSVGRYAIRIRYSSGCSAGIYDFPFLRAMVRDSR